MYRCDPCIIDQPLLTKFTDAAAPAEDTLPGLRLIEQRSRRGPGLLLSMIRSAAWAWVMPGLAASVGAVLASISWHAVLVGTVVAFALAAVYGGALVARHKQPAAHSSATRAIRPHRRACCYRASTSRCGRSGHRMDRAVYPSCRCNGRLCIGADRSAARP